MKTGVLFQHVPGPRGAWCTSWPCISTSKFSTLVGTLNCRMSLLVALSFVTPKQASKEESTLICAIRLALWMGCLFTPADYTWVKTSRLQKVLTFFIHPYKQPSWNKILNFTTVEVSIQNILVWGNIIAHVNVIHLVDRCRCRLLYDQA